MALSRAAAIAFASSAALAVVLASSVAVGDGTDSDGDGISDGLEDATQRTVAVSVAGDEFSVSSHLGTSPAEDQFDLSFHAGTFAVRYDETGGVDSSYDLQLSNLVTWKDWNGNGRMDNGEVFRTQALGSTAFGGVRVLLWNRTDVDGGGVFTFSVRSRDGNVTLNTTVAQRFERIDNVILTPMEARLDISVNPAVIPPGASLGLEFRMYTEDGVHLMDHSWDELNGFASDEHEINVTAVGERHSSTVFFSWSNEAVADGTLLAASLVDGPTSPGPYNVTLAYAFGTPAPTTTFVQRTTLGVRSAVYESRRAAGPINEPRGDPILYGTTIAAVTVLVGLTILVANRRRRTREDSDRKP